MKGKDARKPETKKQAVLRLDDLAPREDVIGGRGKLVFGEGVVTERGVRDAAGRTPRGRGRNFQKPD